MDCRCERNCGHCLQKLCAHGIPVFASLEYGQLERIAGLTVHRRFAKDEVVAEEDSRPDYVAILDEGSVKASTFSADGREQILYIFSEGDFFGEQHLLFDRPSTYRITALEPVELCLIYKKDFLQLLGEQPDIGIRIIGELGWRLSHLETAVQNMGVRSLEARIGAVLLEFADRYGTRTSDGVRIRMPLSREGLASYIGTARETVSRKLGALETDGVIRTIDNRTLLLRDRRALEEASGSTAAGV